MASDRRRTTPTKTKEKKKNRAIAHFHMEKSAALKDNIAGA